MEHVVVGVDESPAAVAAAQWAVETCRVHGARLTMVLAWTYLGQHHGGGVRGFQAEYGEEDAAKALAQIAASIDPHDVAIEQRVICGLPAPALLEASVGADLLVVGARGVGGFRGLLVGSVSQQCAHHTTVPLAIVRGSSPARHDGPVVVGVDGSPASMRALAWAIDEARTRRVRLLVVQAWAPALAPAIGGFGELVPLVDLGAEVEDSVRRAVESVGAAGLVAPAEIRAVSGSPTQAILDASDGASLVVVGSRGRGGFRGLLLGSVSQHIVNHAPCPTVVVPPAR